MELKKYSEVLYSSWENSIFTSLPQRNRVFWVLKKIYFSDIWYDNMSLIQTKGKCQARLLNKKYGALQEVAKGVPKSAIGSKYNVPNNTLSTWIKNKDKII